MQDPINAVPFRNRRTWLIELREIRGWRLKIYGICADGCSLPENVVEAAMDHAAKNVNWPERTTGHGFVTLHAGEEAVWLLVDVWVDDILRHFLFRAPIEDPRRFQPGPNDGTMACVWEMAVLVHERTAWIENVLSSPENPDYAAYLENQLDISI